MRIKVSLIEKSSNKKSEKYNNKSNSRKCKRIEYLIICSVELAIYIPETNHMYHYFYEGCNPKNLSVYTIEYNQKYKIQKREKCHKNAVRDTIV